MGILCSNTAMLLKAAKNRVCFDKVLTLGHQRLRLTEKQMAMLSRVYDKKIDANLFSADKYVDNFFKQILGVKELVSLDYSGYQASDIIHDLNYPIDSQYDGQFDVVIDGGTLEHVFNFPVALENCMRLVKPGGSIFIFTMANNHMGHGFYQFSPELFFRIFTEENGFEVREIVLDRHDYPSAELSSTTDCYQITDPIAVRGRVGLVSPSPVMMMVHAVRREIKPIFSKYPIQSDYVELHKESTQNGADSLKPPLWKEFARAVISHLPASLQNTIKAKRQLRSYSLGNRKFYKKWNPV